MGQVISRPLEHFWFLAEEDDLLLTIGSELDIQDFLLPCRSTVLGHVAEEKRTYFASPSKEIRQGHCQEQVNLFGCAVGKMCRITRVVS